MNAPEHSCKIEKQVHGHMETIKEGYSNLYHVSVHDLNLFSNLPRLAQAGDCVHVRVKILLGPTLNLF